MQRQCQHTRKRYTGLMPCTGNLICSDCGVVIKRERLTDEEYQKALEHSIQAIRSQR